MKKAKKKVSLQKLFAEELDRGETNTPAAATIDPKAKATPKAGQWDAEEEEQTSKEAEDFREETPYDPKEADVKNKVDVVSEEDEEDIVDEEDEDEDKEKVSEEDEDEEVKEEDEDEDKDQVSEEETEDDEATAAWKKAKASGEVSEEDEDEDKDQVTEEDEDEEVKEEDEDEELKEEDEEDKEKIDVQEDIAAIFQGAKLSKAFRKKATLVFESALKVQVGKKKKAIREQYNKKLKQTKKQLSEHFVEQVGSFLDVVVEEWLSENKLAVENGLRTEITEQFIRGMKNLFEQSYISIPEDKVDFVKEVVSEKSKIEKELNEEINKNVALKKALVKYQKQECIAEASRGLSELDKEKFRVLAEEVSLTGSKNDYISKLGLIRESYWPTKRPKETPRFAEKSDATLSSHEGETSGIDLISEAISRQVKRA